MHIANIAKYFLKKTT